MRIDIGEQTQIILKTYRTHIQKRPLAEEGVKDILETGIVERNESPWSFPIVVLDKMYRGHRLCVDFRKLNAISKPLKIFDR